jgi:hypothetical protein
MSKRDVDFWEATKCYFARPDPILRPTVTLSRISLNPAQITTRQVNYAVPANTTAEQWQQINRAVTYAESQGVKVKVTSVK